MRVSLNEPKNPNRYIKFYNSNFRKEFSGSIGNKLVPQYP
jgi:hypothetical protein